MLHELTYPHNPSERLRVMKGELEAAKSAKALISKKRDWCKYHRVEISGRHGDRYRYCTQGALEKTSGYCGGGDFNFERATRYIHLVYRFENIVGECVWVFNDRRSTKHKDVLKKFDILISQLEADIKYLEHEAQEARELKYERVQPEVVTEPEKVLA